MRDRAMTVRRRRDRRTTLIGFGVWCVLIGPAAANQVVVQHLGNAGFLLRAGERKVLIDALYRDGVRGYAVHAPERLHRLEQALPPYDDVDLVLASHHHADHFDAHSVASHLEHNPRAVFFSTPQAVERLSALESYAGLRGRVFGVLPDEGEPFRSPRHGLEAYNLHHGRERPIQNLGFLIRHGDVDVLHVGDTVATASDFAASGLSIRSIDIALLGYWYGQRSDLPRVIEALGARRLGLMHVTPGYPFDPEIEARGGWIGFAERLRATHPDSIVFSSATSSSLQIDLRAACPGELRLAAAGEPGRRMRIEGVVLAPDGSTPLAGVKLKVYHADAEGYYRKGPEGQELGSSQARLRGEICSDAAGRFHLESVEPSIYAGGGPPAHIHIVALRADGPEHHSIEMSELACELSQAGEVQDSTRRCRARIILRP